MTRWLASHVYLAEWIATLPVFWLMLRGVIRATKASIPTLALCVTASAVIVSIRLSGNGETLKEMARYMALAVVGIVVCEALGHQKAELTASVN